MKQKEKVFSANYKCRRCGELLPDGGRITIYPAQSPYEGYGITDDMIESRLNQVSGKTRIHKCFDGYGVMEIVSFKEVK